MPYGPPELKPNWRALWLGSIDEIASFELQRATWLSPLNENPHWSFVEFRESYFEQFNLRDGYGYALENGIVSAQEATAVEHFHSLLNEYAPPKGDEYDHAAILADPNWRAVVSAATTALEQILALSFNSPSYLATFTNA